jgi:hypothetical protein
MLSNAARLKVVWLPQTGAAPQPCMPIEVGP